MVKRIVIVENLLKTVHKCTVLFVDVLSLIFLIKMWEFVIKAKFLNGA